jgi:hypothetical protein
MNGQLRRLARLTILCWSVIGSTSACSDQVQQPHQSEDSASSQSVANKESPWTTEPVESDRSGIDPIVLQAVDVEQESRSDRITFAFEGTAAPGYRIAYVQGPVTQCGSGEALTLGATQYLWVRLSPAQAHTEAGTKTIKQPERQLDMPVLKELKLSCDFEGEVSWVLGLSMEKKYRVSELSGPPRLVVDIEH